MPFHVWNLMKDIHSSFVHLDFSSRRMRFVAWFTLLFPPIILFGRLGFLIDNIFYGRYKTQPIEKPLFIIGNYRSGDRGPGRGGPVSRDPAR